MYEMVVGFEGRMKWRREMEGVKIEIRKIDEMYFANDRVESQRAEM